MNAEIDPKDHSVEVTTRAHFTCRAEGYESDMFRYQWRLNSSDIAGATSKRYTITSANESDQGSYKCVVFNHLNQMITSSVVKLSITRHLPVITTHPMDSMVLLYYGNESAVFSCDASGSDVQYTWFTVANDGSIMIEGESSNVLVLSPVTVDMNNTQYYCVVSNNSGSVESDRAHLTVYTFIEAMIAPHDQLVEVSSRVCLTCNAVGYQSSTFKYYWRLNGSVIDVATNRKLIIVAVNESDHGNYECVVINDWNVISISTSVQLIVTRHRPQILTNPVNVTVLIGGTNLSMASFECTTTTADHSWLVIPPSKDPTYYEKPRLISTSTQQVNVTLATNGTLLFCQASNASGTVTSSSATLTILVPPPMITRHPKQLINASVGEMVIFQCIATSYGHANNLKYFWLNDVDQTVVSNSSTFVIEHVTPEDDSTFYQCVAVNENGTATYSRKGRINILPHIIRQPENISVPVNSSVALCCEAVGGSNFTYQWRKDDKLLASQDGGVYIIDRVVSEDMGNYSCEATNSRGEVAISLHAIISVFDTVAISDVTVESVADVSVTLKWKISRALAPTILYILVNITARQDAITDFYPANAENITVTDLIPSFSYNISIAAVFNSTSYANNLITVTITVPECSVCNEPQLIDTGNKSLSSLMFTLHWLPLPNKTLLDSFTLFYTNTSLVDQQTLIRRQQPDQRSIELISPDLLEYTVDGLSPYSTYCFWLQSVYSKRGITFDHKQSTILCDILTPTTEPSAPLNLKVEEVGHTWVSVLWTPPLYKNGIIQYYTVYYGEGLGHKSYNLTVNVMEITNQLPLWYMISNLTANTSYSVTVTASTYVGSKHYLEGPRSSMVTFKTLQENATLNQAGIVGSKSQSNALITGVAAGLSIAVVLVLITGILFVVWYRAHLRKPQHSVSVIEKSQKEMSELQKPKPEIENLSTKLSAPYINVDIENVITSADQPTTVCIKTGGFPPPEVEWFKDEEPVNNPVLSDGSLYIVYTTPNDSGCYTVKAANSVNSAIKEVTVNVLEPSPPVADHASYKAVKVEDFASHVAMLHENKDQCLNKEFSEAVTTDQQFSKHNAKLVINQSKNRYTNIVPYDHSRVVIGISHKLACSDYINASYVDGYNNKFGEYIATQAPIPSTYEDFWKMIWEKKCSTIVMLANLKENGKVKCHQYWPSHGHVVYGSQRVTLQAVDCLSDCTIRVFNVEMANGRSKNSYFLEVHQFQFNMWPEHGESQLTTPLLSFCKRVDRFHKRGDAPMVVHCSAGVDRTGTFIVIDAQLQRIKNESSVDIFNNVRQLCYSRNYLVSTQAQYMFIHEAVLESMISADTIITPPVGLASKLIAKLDSIDSTSGNTGFQMQFEKLQDITTNENSSKCSLNQIQQPITSTEVTLSTSDNGSQSDNINAHFINGYYHCKAYICAQNPAEAAIGDFWQMIWEQKSRVIVFISEESNEEQQLRYWPEVGKCTYKDAFTIECVDENQFQMHCVRRDFKVFNTANTSYSRNIVHLCFHQWPLNSYPEKFNAVIDLLNSIEKLQNKIGNGPITVHCSDGLGRSGTLCALAICVQSYKAEKSVDVFQTVKKMRIQKPGVIKSVEQYEFIYKAMLEFISH